MLSLPLDLGQLQRLRIGHDSKGSLPRWHLAHVVVNKKDGSMAPSVTFPCGELRASLRFEYCLLIARYELQTWQGLCCRQQVGPNAPVGTAFGHDRAACSGGNWLMWW
jgi:hypothetical protein